MGCWDAKLDGLLLIGGQQKAFEMGPTESFLEAQHIKREDSSAVSVHLGLFLRTFRVVQSMML